MKYLKLLIVFFLLSCSMKPEYPLLKYNNSGLSHEKLAESYKDVLIHKGTDFKKFVLNIEPIEKNEKLKKKPLTYYTNKFQIFIDENGDTESIFLIDPSRENFDSLSFNAIKQMKFRPLKHNNDFIKYSLVISYIDRDDIIIYPAINGKRTDPVLKTTRSSLKGITIIGADSLYKSTLHTLQLTKKGLPKYPDIARRQGVEGRVNVLISVDKNGNVTEAAILNGPELLHRPSIVAALKCKFEPLVINGEKMSAKMTIPFDYRLKR